MAKHGGCTSEQRGHINKKSVKAEKSVVVDLFEVGNFARCHVHIRLIKLGISWEFDASWKINLFRISNRFTKIENISIIFKFDYQPIKKHYPP